ncbi:MAG: preprotein translocase subunit SecE [Deltaproteobacteria bacterium CG11_big_fil_rev_8_21_14_0_20_49_13]|nr:MAG: preprotein translocase subunit SecE [Deltaproteobacteria bacterium CG11_big_fil_rev_8_21_14_0_20_49_13]
MDNKKIVNGAFVGIGVIVWIFVKQIVDTIWGIVKFPVPQDWPFTPADLFGTIAAVAAFVMIKKNQRINRFSNEVLAELSKVTWPPRKETLLSTVVVSVMVAICAVILFGFDTLWGTLVKILYQ